LLKLLFQFANQIVALFFLFILPRKQIPPQFAALTFLFPLLLLP
jgi:hypothetical protein